MQETLNIQVRSNTDPAVAELLSTLERLLPLKFVPQRDRASARITFGEPEPEPVEGVFSLALPQRRESVGEPRKVKIQFADDRHVPFPFRGRTLTVTVATEPKVLSLREGETVLAKTEQGIVWSVSTSGVVKQFRTAFELPGLPAGGLQDLLSGERFVELLPLLHLLQSVSAGHSHEPPPLRAQFMFDDPNLHWPSYGYVDFKE